MAWIARPALVLLAAAAAACGPRVNIPGAPLAVSGGVMAPDSTAELARRLAPTLYLHEDERFPLARVVAVQHPTRPVVAYHLLWEGDLHGAWVPFTNATDQEIVWVTYDEARQPVALSTYWHGTILTADWRGRGPPEVDVQWGQHGSMPRGVIESDLPWQRRLGLFYAFSWLAPDMALGRFTRDGPLCFCAGRARYREFTRVLPLHEKLDLVVVAEDPDPVLTQVFGAQYSRKVPWPELLGTSEREQAGVSCESGQGDDGTATNSSRGSVLPDPDLSRPGSIGTREDPGCPGDRSSSPDARSGRRGGRR